MGICRAPGGEGHTLSGDAQKTKAELIAELEALRETVMESTIERSRRALRESEDRFRILTETSDDAVEVISETGQTLSVNPAIQVLLDYTPEECLGMDITDWSAILHPDDCDRVIEQFEQVKEGRKTIYYDPFRCQRKDGSWIWVKAIGTAFVSASGELRILEVTRDITEQMEAEQRRQKLAEQRKEAERLESLGVLAGGIAHDFNNILVAIIGNSDLALHKLSALSPARPLIERIIRGGERAVDLCSQMLAYSGKRQLAVTAIDLNKVVEEISELLEISVSKKVVLQYELAASLPAVEADAIQLPQVVMNLIVNASEAIGKNRGVIGISTGVLACDGDYWKQAVFSSEDISEGDYVFLEVSDTGCGMDEQTKQKIFDPFFTTKFTGRGLGLATVLGIARAYKGAIDLRSEPGKGTIIKVLFPAVQQPAQPLAKDAPVPKDWRGHGTVLLVDDEEPVLTVGRMMLENLGFAVRTARDGREAVEVFREYQGEFVCVVLDLMMPNMDGAETLRELRQIQEGVKVVFSSGYHEQDVTERLAGVSFEGFLKKPYMTDTLIEQLRRVLEADG